MHAGTTYFFGSGSSLILMALGEDETDLHYVSCHEFGHAIGKLADEYDQEGLTFSDIDRFQADSQKGFCPNLDITADPKSVKWHRFLEDSRYANEGLGVLKVDIRSMPMVFGVLRRTALWVVPPQGSMLRLVRLSIEM